MLMGESKKLFARFGVCEYLTDYFTWSDTRIL